MTLRGASISQTHLTLLDDTRAPLPNTPVKVWADAPTALLLNGQLHQVGPGDAECAVAQSGPDGVVTLVSGAVAPGGADRPNVSAVPLRVWAPFMDPYERMVVFPDREFHNRLATAHATTTGDPAYDDPDRINLQTATNYAGKPLFSDAERQQGQPQQAATAIQQMTAMVGLSGPAGGRATHALVPALRAGAVQTWVQRDTDTPDRYLAYADLPGARYSPVATPTPRPVAVLQPAGLHAGGGGAGGLRLLPPAEAAAAIDALQGSDWVSGPHAPAHVRAAARAGAVRVGSWWGDFWDWLKGAAATVTDVIVSAAEEVYVGIRMIVDGVAQVFRQVITGLEDAVSAIATFFKQLAKDIADVIQALAVLFQFEEIKKTQAFLKGELLARANGIPGNASYPGIAATMQAKVKQPVDAFFQQGEQAISGAFNNLANQIAGQGTASAAGDLPLTGLKGAGTTAHTAYTVQPKGGGRPISHAPQCTWALQKLKTGLGPGGAAGPGGGAPARAVGGTDPSEAFVEGFAQRLESDATLSAQWEKLRAGAGTMGNASSAGDFLRQGVAELLRTLALLLEGALAVANAFLDGFLDLFGALVSTLLDPTTGLLTAELEIPVLSWLYRQLFGEPLTIVNAVTLVAAIPVTLLWRVIKGQWPSQSLGPQNAARAAVTAVAAEVMGILGGVLAIVNGVLTAIAVIAVIADMYEVETELHVQLARLVCTCGVFTALITIPDFNTTGVPSAYAYGAWGMGTLSGMLLTLIAFGGAEPERSASTKAFLKVFLPLETAALGLAQLAFFIVDFVKAPDHRVADNVAFGVNIAALVPGIFTPLVLTGEVGSAIFAVVALVDGLAVGLLTILIAAGSYGGVESAGALAAPAGGSIRR